MTPIELPTTRFYPLSGPQREVWLDQIMHPEVPFYNVGAYARIDGPLDVAMLERALRHVVQQNDNLRIMLEPSEGLPTQRIAEHVFFDLEYRDLSGMEDAGTRAQEWLQRELARPIHLYNSPLFHFAVLKTAENCYYWLTKYHHVIIDAWACMLVCQRVAAAYNALLARQPLPEGPRLSYVDFIIDDHAYAASEQFQRDAAYWCEKFATIPEPLLPRRHGVQPSGEGGTRRRSKLVLSRELFGELQAFAVEHGTSPFQVILGLLYCYFVRVAQRNDFAVGISTLNRSTADFRQTAGMFTNAIPVWYRFGVDLCFRELLEALSQEAQRGAPHRRFPLGEINRRVGLVRLNRSQVFDVSVTFPSESCDAQFGEAPVTFRFIPGFAQSGMLIAVEKIRDEGGVQLLFEGNPENLTKDDMERLPRRLELLLGEILRRPGVPIRELEIMPEAERRQVLVEWNDTATEGPSDKYINELFDAQVERTPEAVAVVFEQRELTYRELNRRANQLAHHLRSLGVGAEVLVGLCVERSLEMVVGLLGILKAGGAYVPLDPTYPKERLAFMLADARVPVLLTQARLEGKLPAHEAVVVDLDAEAPPWAQQLDTPPGSGAEPDNLAYVIYTSGSTGQPKGVQIQRGALMNLLEAFAEQIGIGVRDTLLAVSSLSFDIATLELCLPLIRGATILLASRGEATRGEALRVALERATVMQATPTTWRMVLEAGWQGGRSLRALCGGEVMSLELAAELTQQADRVWNGYGPTETTIYSAAHRVGVERGEVPIGRAIANTQLYVLDQNLRPMPVGVSGHLHISGMGLSRGYLRRPELTAERFVPNPFSPEPGARMYRTGDLARWNEDGALEFLGRIDHQVKIRGFRIELGEIEAALLSHASVRACVVVAREDTPVGKRLLAYVVPGEGKWTPSALREHLRGRLPEYMVPSAFVRLEALPLTPSGKVDRKALPAPGGKRDSEQGYVAPRTPVEEGVVELWEQLLGIRPIGVHDDFFALGGHSVLAVRLVTALERRFSRALPLAQLFSHRTVAEMAVALSPAWRAFRADEAHAWSESPLVTLHEAGHNAPLFCVHAIGGTAFCYEDLARELGPEQPLYGLQARILDRDREAGESIEVLAARYLAAIREAHPEGPYHLCGWSFGGVVAFEMAQQLVGAGAEVGALVLLDSPVSMAEPPVGAIEDLPAYLHAMARTAGAQGLAVDLDELRSLGVTGARVRLAELMEEAGWFPKGHAADVVGGIAATMEAHERALRRYVPRLYSGSLTLLRARDHDRHDDATHVFDFDWSPLCTGWFHVHIVPGTHETMVLPPHVGELAQVLSVILDATSEPRTQRAPSRMMRWGQNS